MLLVGVLVAATLTFTLAQRDRREVIAHFHGREAAQRIADMLRVLGALPPDRRAAVVASLNPEEWRLASADTCNGGPAPHLKQGLDERLGGAVRIERATRFDADDDQPGPPALAVSGRFSDGEPFCLVHQGKRRVPPQIEQWRFPASLVLFVGLIALVAWFAVRLALRPLARLGEAMEAFGRDIRHPPLKACGPREVRQVQAAFNAMQERVRGYMAERTQILAAVTHDLKTPLTRMRLRAESCDDPLREKLGADLAAMQSLIDEGLELARSMEASEETQRIDLGALLASIADDAADAGQAVSYAGPLGVAVDCRAHGLRRAIENLVDNALKYGDGAEIALDVDGPAPLIRVRDHGPGIAPEQLDEVLKPFVRLESSRCRESGGTGLGLAIAANLVAAQGGQLRLRNHPDGGLEASIVLAVSR